jgi:hypothetical protein
MTTLRRLRARILLDEAAALGLDLTDLIAAAEPGTDVTSRVPAVADHVDTIAATFTPGTARVHKSYWRLAVKLLGDRRLDDITIADLQAVVDHAVQRCRRDRPDSPGRATRETCVSALRAMYGRAVAAGLVSTNPALALVKPRRVRSRRRALSRLLERHATTRGAVTPDSPVFQTTRGAPITSCVGLPVQLVVGRHDAPRCGESGGVRRNLPPYR